jgi:hypothetical protein
VPIPSLYHRMDEVLLRASDVLKNIPNAINPSMALSGHASNNPCSVHWPNVQLLSGTVILIIRSTTDRGMGIHT